MLKKYFYICLIAGNVAGSSLMAEGVDVPRARDLRKILHERCQEKFNLIQKADAPTRYYPKLLSCYKRIQNLENTNGITQLHNEQATLMNSLCIGEHQPNWCDDLERFKQFDQKRIEGCTTAKCTIMKLYNQLNAYTLKLAEVLKPHNTRLRELNTQINDLRTQLKTAYGLEEEIFNLHPNMLYL